MELRSKMVLHAVVLSVLLLPAFCSVAHATPGEFDPEDCRWNDGISTVETTKNDVVIDGTSVTVMKILSTLPRRLDPAAYSELADALKRCEFTESLKMLEEWVFTFQEAGKCLSNGSGEAVTMYVEDCGKGPENKRLTKKAKEKRSTFPSVLLREGQARPERYPILVAERKAEEEREKLRLQEEAAQLIEREKTPEQNCNALCDASPGSTPSNTKYLDIGYQRGFSPCLSEAVSLGTTVSALGCEGRALSVCMQACQGQTPTPPKPAPEPATRRVVNPEQGFRLLKNCCQKGGGVFNDQAQMCSWLEDEWEFSSCLEDTYIRFPSGNERPIKPELHIH